MSSDATDGLAFVVVGRDALGPVEVERSLEATREARNILSSGRFLWQALTENQKPVNSEG